MNAHRTEELAALAVPPVVVARQQCPVVDELFAAHRRAVVGFPGEPFAGGVTEPHGHLTAGTQPDAQEAGLAPVTQDRQVEHLPEVGVRVGVGDVGVGVLDPFDVGVRVVPGQGFGPLLVPEALVPPAPGVLVVRQQRQPPLTHQRNDLTPKVLELAVVVHPGIAAALGGVPVLAGAELEQVLAVGVHPQELHHVGLVAVPVQPVGDAALRLFPAGDHAVGHLFAPEDVSAREAGRRGAAGGLQTPRFRHGVQANAGDGRAVRGRDVPRRKLGDADVEAVLRRQGPRAAAADEGSVREAVVEVEEHGPGLVSARQRDLERFVVVPDVLRVERVAEGRAAVHAADGLVAPVEYEHAARHILGELDDQYVGGPGGQQLHSADAERDVGRLTLGLVQNATGTAQNGLHAAHPRRVLGKRVVG